MIGVVLDACVLLEHDFLEVLGTALIPQALNDDRRPLLGGLLAIT